MPLVNKQPFTPNPIPDDLKDDDEVFYHELTNEIFRTHDEFFDRFLYCNSLIWTCARTGKSGLTYKEALDSEFSGALRKRRQAKQIKQTKQVKQKRKQAEESVKSTDEETTSEQPQKKKKKKYPYDPKKYAMPVPEGFDPSLLTPTGKIDGRKLKSKKHAELADQLLALSNYQPSPKMLEKLSKGGVDPGSPEVRTKRPYHRKVDSEGNRIEKVTHKKAQTQAELARERELEAKRKKEAALMAKQMEKQKKEEEKKKAATFLQNWEKKCEDLERDDLMKLPQPIPLNSDISEKLFGDAIYILEALYNLHDLYQISTVFPEGITYDTLEEMLFDRHEDGPLGKLIQFLLRLILDTQPTGDGYGFEDDARNAAATDSLKQENGKTHLVKHENDGNARSHEGDDDNDDTHEHDHDNEHDEVDKDVNMNDLIGAAIRAAQEVRKSLAKPLAETEITQENVTEILRMHFLQSGSFPKGRTIYNGWYSSREDPGLWLCMQEPELIKKLAEVTIFDLDIEERIKILQTLIYQLLTFIKTRLYIEAANEQLTELRKKYRKEAAEFGKWDRENFVKRMAQPKRKNEQQGGNHSFDKSVNHSESKYLDHNSNPSSINGDEGDYDGSRENPQLKSCLKSNGTGGASNNQNSHNDLNDDNAHRKKISFKANGGGSSELATNGVDRSEMDNSHLTDKSDRLAPNGEIDSEQTYEEQERAYQQNQVDYEDYHRERAIRLEQLNQSLLSIRTNLRNTQAIYGVHPIGRDRAYRRYWLFQSLPGLFVEQDDDYTGKCVKGGTPLESQFKKLFKKENPLLRTDEADLIRHHNCTTSNDANVTSSPRHIKSELDAGEYKYEADEDVKPHPNGKESLRTSMNGDEHDDQDEKEEADPPCDITDDMNICTGDQATCAIHGQRKPAPPRWWFYYKPEHIDNLVRTLNKRGHRESELLEVLSTESSILKPWISQCPAYKMSKLISDDSANIRRSRRLKTRTGKGRKGRNYD